MTRICLYVIVIRNLPVDTDDKKLVARLQTYGAVKYCRLVVNKSSGLFGGSAFIQFLTSPAVRRCVLAADTTDRKEGVVFGGNQLNIVVAVAASELSKENLKKSKEDKRNLHLANEGGEGGR